MARYIQQDGQLINVAGGPRLPGFTHAVIHHGDDPDVPRPDELDVVTWVGEVEPINMANGDFWEASFGFSSETVTDYVRTDAANPLTAPLSSPDPVDPEHLTTKSYIDGEVVELTGYIDDEVDTRLPLTGGTLTGSLGGTQIDLVGNNPGSTNNTVIDLGSSYTIHQDGTGAGSDDTRIWWNTPAGGDFVIGPRSGGTLNHRILLRADTTTLLGDLQVNNRPYPTAMAAGTVSVTFSNSQNGTGAISYPSGRFSSAPRVFFQVHSGAGNAIGMTFRAISNSSTGVTCSGRANGTLSESFSVYWFAVEV